MSKMITWFILSLCLATVSGLAQERRLGIGLILGTPTGLSVTYATTSREAIHGYVGGGFGDVSIGADYAMHSAQFRDPNVLFYYAPGAFLGSASFGGPRSKTSSTGIGVRLMFGVEYLIPQSRFDLGFEIGPALLLAPSGGLGLEAAFVARFFP